jgi:hypothetical protein
LGSRYLREAHAEQIVKNIVFLTLHMKNNPEVHMAEIKSIEGAEEKTESVDLLHWVFRRLSHMLRKRQNLHHFEPVDPIRV